MSNNVYIEKGDWKNLTDIAFNTQGLMCYLYELI